MIQFNLYLYKDSNQGSCQLVYLSKSSSISKFQVDCLYYFFLLTTNFFWRYGLIKQCLQNIFLFRNLMTNIFHNMLSACSFNPRAPTRFKVKIQIRFQLISIQIIVITNSFLYSTKIMFFHKNFKAESYIKKYSE